MKTKQQMEAERNEQERVSFTFLEKKEKSRCFWILIQIIEKGVIWSDLDDGCRKKGKNDLKVDV